MARTDPYAALRFPEFTFFLVMRFALVFAWAMQFVVIEWEIYSLTKDPLSLGIIGLAEVIPAVSLALIAGHVTDRVERRGLLLKRVLGFLSITVTGFIALFPGNIAGVECAAIFAIFTSQAWNMAFSLYQSFRTIPGDLLEAAAMFRLSPWQRFWRLEVPFAMPGLLWNMMMSMSGGWFFVVASEAISVSGHDIRLPGIGSYIALAIQQQDLAAIASAFRPVASFGRPGACSSPGEIRLVIPPCT